MRSLSLIASMSLLVGALGCESKQQSEEPTRPDTTSTAQEPAAPSAEAKSAEGGEGAVKTIEPKKIGARGKKSVALVGSASIGKRAPTVADHIPGPSGVTTMRFGKDDTLFVGYNDGRFAAIDVTKKSGELKRAVDEPLPISALSPDGSLAIVASNPPKLVNTRAHADLINFTHTESYDGVAFSPDGKTMFMASKQGPMRVWRDADKLGKEMKGEVRLEEYLLRQQGDLSVNFGPMASQLSVESGPHVAYVEPDGQIVFWDMNEPTQANYVLRLAPPVTSMTILGEHLIATSGKGDLRVSNIEHSNMERWSVTASADLVASDPALTDSFIAVRHNKLERLGVTSGDVIWSAPLEHAAKDLCGLQVSKAKDRVVVCVNDKLSVYALGDGAAAGALARQGAELTWQ